MKFPKGYGRTEQQELTIGTLLNATTDTMPCFEVSETYLEPFGTLKQRADRDIVEYVQMGATKASTPGQIRIPMARDFERCILPGSKTQWCYSTTT